jgi:hypothetical protein
VSAPALRPIPLPRVAAVFALPAAAVAVAVGAGPAFAVAAVCACASGLIIGGGGKVTLVAVWLAVVAAGAGAVVGARPAPAPSSPAPVIRADLAPAAPPPRSRHHTGPKALVRAYYAALDAHRFTRAWARLSPAVQARFGGFAHWRRGYATTLGHRTEHVTVDGHVVRLTLVATDRTPCGGTTVQRFAVTWRLTGRRATALSAARLAGEVPAAAC